MKKENGLADSGGFAWWEDATLCDAVLKKRAALLEDVAILDDSFERVLSSPPKTTAALDLTREEQTAVELWRALRRIVASSSGEGAEEWR